MNVTLEKKWLLLICGLCTSGLILLGVLAIVHGVASSGDTILGVIAGGLIAFGKDLVAAVRSYAMAASLQRATDQIAQSGPVPSNGGQITGDIPTNANGAIPVEIQQPAGQSIPVHDTTTEESK